MGTARKIRESIEAGILETETLIEAANEIDRLRNAMRAAVEHSCDHFLKNGAKPDDQLGVVALLLIDGLGLLEKND